MRKTYIRELTQLASDWVVIQHMAGLQPYYNPRHVPAIVREVDIEPSRVIFYRFDASCPNYGPCWVQEREIML